MKRSQRVGASVLAALAAAGATSGRGLVPKGRLLERFEDKVHVSGSTLVGLRRGPGTGALDLSQLSVDLPPNAAGVLCLRMSTRDGRYTASQAFDLRSPSPGATPLGFGAGVYERQLKAYGAGELAAKAELLPDCDSDAEPRLLPVRSVGATDTLVAQVNVKLSKASLELEDEAGAALTSGPCSMVSGGSSTAYDHVCVAPLSNVSLARATRLKLTIVGTTGSRRSEVYRVGLAP